MLCEKPALGARAYKTIAEDANGQTLYRKANAYDGSGPEIMCVIGGLADAAGFNVRVGFPSTNDAIDFVVEHYPLTLSQCIHLVDVNDEYESTVKRREALIAQVRKYEESA